MLNKAALNYPDKTNKIEISNVFFVPTFDTKVTEYLFSGWIFFSSDIFRLFN